MVYTVAELPTSTFLPYFVRFLNENTAFMPKYVFFKFMLWKHGQSFLIIMFKNKAKIAPEST